MKLLDIPNIFLTLAILFEIVQVVALVSINEPWSAFLIGTVCTATLYALLKRISRQYKLQKLLCTNEAQQIILRMAGSERRARYLEKTLFQAMYTAETAEAFLGIVKEKQTKENPEHI